MKISSSALGGAAWAQRLLFSRAGDWALTCPHGFFDQLQGSERLLPATHEGELPTQIADLALLIALALCADAERLVRGIGGSNRSVGDRLSEYAECAGGQAGDGKIGRTTVPRA